MTFITGNVKADSLFEYFFVGDLYTIYAVKNNNVFAWYARYTVESNFKAISGTKYSRLD